MVGMDTDLLYVKSLFRGTGPRCPSILKDIRDAELSDSMDFERSRAFGGNFRDDPLRRYQCKKLTYDINYKASIQPRHNWRSRTGVRDLCFLVMQHVRSGGQEF